MRFYEKYFKNNYDELIRFYPRYYREVYEMVEILKANGAILDELEDNIETTFLNNFIDYADEATIQKLERFLHIALNRQRTLSDRRRLVKAFFAGFGKISASMLKALIGSYTNAEVDIKFEPSDEEGNNTLYINFERGKEEHIYMSDIIMLLSRKLPAHINWRAAIVYRYGIGIGVRRTHYPIEYKLSGTIPEIALLGEIFGTDTVIEQHRRHYRTDYSQASPNVLSGTIPDTATIGSIHGVETVVSEKDETYTYEHIKSAQDALRAGEHPQEAYIGRILGADVVVSEEHEDTKVEHKATGVEPELATLAEIISAEIAARAGREHQVYEHEITAENELKAGTHPEDVLLGQAHGADVAVSERHKAEKGDYKTTGVEPEIATLANIINRKAATEAEHENYTYEHEVAGTKPEPSSIPASHKVETVAEKKRTNYRLHHKAASEGDESGTEPKDAELGNINRINAGAEVTVTETGIDYITCGDDLI